MAPNTPDQTPDQTPGHDASGPDRPDRPIRQDGSLLDMPRPPKRKRSKLVWVFVLAVLVAGAALWQLRDLVLRDAVPDRQANMTGTDAAIPVSYTHLNRPAVDLQRTPALPAP